MNLGFSNIRKICVLPVVQWLRLDLRTLCREHLLFLLNAVCPIEVNSDPPLF